MNIAAVMKSALTLCEKYFQACFTGLESDIKKNGAYHFHCLFANSVDCKAK